MLTLEKILQTIKSNKDYLHNKYGVDNIAVFGSYLTNRHDENSDIDIFVDLENKYQTFDNFMELKFYLEEILGSKIDLSIKESIRKEFRNKILNEAIYG